MNKFILVMLILLPFEVIHAVEERYLEQYWIDDDMVKAWLKLGEIIPIQEGDLSYTQARKRRSFL